MTKGVNDGLIDSVGGILLFMESIKGNDEALDFIWTQAEGLHRNTECGVLTAFATAIANWKETDR